MFKHAKSVFYHFKQFTIKNPEYLICSLIYYIVSVYWIGWGLWQFWIILGAVYVLSLIVVFSPLGEIFMRMFAHVRPLETAEEKEYLRPLFAEVCAEAEMKNPKELVKSKIDIYIIDQMTVNAVAIGRNTVAVTKGAVKTFSEDELKAVIAHEIAHIVNMDTIALMFSKIGNGIFSIGMISIRLFGWIFSKIHITRPFAAVVDTIFNAIFTAFFFIMQAPLSLRSRKSEKRADSYALELGIGEDMVSALYTLEKINLSGEASLIQKILASHPRVTSRIEALELALGIQEYEEERNAGRGNLVAVVKKLLSIMKRELLELWGFMGMSKKKAVVYLIAITIGSTIGAVLHYHFPDPLGLDSRDMPPPTNISVSSENNGFITPPGIPDEREDVFGAPGAAAAQVTDPTFDNILIHARNNATARPVQDFGIQPGIMLEVFPVAVGNSNTAIGNSGYTTELIAGNTIVVDEAPNVVVVFIPHNATINQDGSMYVYWIDADGNDGMNRMRLR